jgi:hypothetical protein
MSYRGALLLFIVVIAFLGRMSMHHRLVPSFPGTDSIPTSESDLDSLILPAFNNSSNCFFTSSASILANRRRLSLGNSAPSGSVLPNHTALIPVIAIPFAEFFGELLQLLMLTFPSANSFVFGHLHWYLWNLWSNILFEGFPS